MISQTLKVTKSERFKKRTIINALGDDILRYIAELVTNSDDSYRRLEQSNSDIANIPKKIYIQLGKGNRSNDKDVITIIDNAEGMDIETLKSKFQSYGSDHIGGVENKARGIFGQGASDVLTSAATDKKTSVIISIKNDRMSKLTYHVDEHYDPSITIEEVELRKNVFSEFRKNNKIPANGTIVSFGIPTLVKFTKNIRKNLKVLIETCPSFRYLLNQQNREIILIQDGKETKLSSSEYSFDKKQQVSSNNFTYKFEDKNISCELLLYKNDIKDIDKTNIIVRDENYVVYDNTMFDFANVAAAQNISGELIINGFYEICRDKLNDSNNPIAIVHDNRTGFDTKKPFYLGLNKLLNPIIADVLGKFGIKTKQINLTNNKKFSDALRELNKYIDSELKETVGGNIKGSTPPPEGIKFVRSNVSFTLGKTYDLKLLVNTNLVSIDDTIFLNVEENNSIETSPNAIKIQADEINDSGLITKNLTIKALNLTTEPIKVEAKCKSYKTIALINVISEDIHYPTNGLEFYEHELELTYNVPHHCKLYFDTEIVPIGSRIILSTSGIELKQTEIEVTSNLLYPNSTIGVIDIVSTGGNVNNEYSIIASFEKISTKVTISLVESNAQSSLGGGLVSGLRIEGSKAPHQTFYQPNTHIIVINSKNVINMAIMGDLDGKNPDSPKFDKEETKYVSDLVAAEAATQLVKTQNARKGEFSLSDPETLIDDYKNTVQLHKNKMFNLFYKVLINK